MLQLPKQQLSFRIRQPATRRVVQPKCLLFQHCCQVLLASESYRDNDKPMACSHSCLMLCRNEIVTFMVDELEIKEIRWVDAMC